MIASVAFIVRTCLRLILYTVLLCGQDPSGCPQLVLSYSYSVKKNLEYKGDFRGIRGNPPGSATEMGLKTEPEWYWYHLHMWCMLSKCYSVGADVWKGDTKAL